jgi:hypothetical protein
LHQILGLPQENTAQLSPHKPTWPFGRRWGEWSLTFPRSLDVGGGILELVSRLRRRRGEKERRCLQPQDLPPPATGVGPYQVHRLHVPLPSSAAFPLTGGRPTPPNICSAANPCPLRRRGGLAVLLLLGRRLVPYFLSPPFVLCSSMYYEGCFSRSRNVSTAIRAAAC